MEYLLPSSSLRASLRFSSMFWMRAQWIGIGTAHMATAIPQCGARLWQAIRCIDSCTFEMQYMAPEALRRSSSQEKAPRARKVMKSLHGDQLEYCLVSSGDLHKPTSRS